ncbi:MAG: flagellin [Armatimonadota bacterium]
MSLRINLNTAALTAQRLLSKTDSTLSKTIERLSSGYRINSAADDPAGLVISEKLRAQVGGLSQAISNAGDAVNMVKTAEGALVEVNSLLSSMRDLAVHAANAGANDTAAVSADQAQIDNAIASINKIAEETQFGNKKLLDGSAGVKTTVTGLAVTGGNLNYAKTLNDTDSVCVKVTKLAEQATFSSKDFGADDDVAVSLTDGSFQLTGNGTTVDIDYTSSTTVAQLAAAINAKTSQTGIVATTDGSGVIKFTSQDYGSNTTISITGAGDILTSGLATAASGVNAEATVTHNGNTENVSDATWASGNGTTIKDSLGNTINLTVAAATTGINTSYLDQLAVEKGSLVFQVGAYAGQTRDINIQSCNTSGLGMGASLTMLSVSDLNVMTPDDAQEAINVLDKAISDVSSLRANLGATQTNVLESSINSLSVAKENIASSESTIRDTDMAEEIVNLTRSQILEQAGVSMLSQANQTPQTLLKLLQ